MKVQESWKDGGLAGVASKSLNVQRFSEHS